MKRSFRCLILLGWVCATVCFGEEMSHNRVIFLNGPSSCGKSTLAHKLQDELSCPYLHIGIDTVIGMMPPGLNDWTGKSVAEGFSWELAKDFNDNQLAHIRIGPLGHQMRALLKNVVLTLLEEGHNVIVDEVCVVEGSFNEWKQALSLYPTLYVGLQASSEELERREKARGDRVIGSARAQNLMVHKNNQYDIELDVEKLSLEECVAQIQACIN